MKIIYIYLLSLFFTLDVMSEEKICNAMNGIIQVSKAFRWKNWLLIIMNDGDAYRIEFQWDGTDLSVGKPLPLTWWKNHKLRLVFPVDYPSKGRLLMGVGWDYSDKVENWTIHLIHLKDSGLVEKWSPIILKGRQCSANAGKDPLRLCTLFAHFSDELLENNLQTILSFPTPIEDLPTRFFAYISVPQNSLKSNETNQTIRQVYVGRNVYTGKGGYQLNWVIDPSTTKLKDNLQDMIIDASASLTDYILNGDRYLFDFIDYFGTQFTIYRAMVNKNNVFEELKWRKNGSIAWLFGCQPNTSEVFALTPGPTKTEPPTPETTTNEPTTQPTTQPIVTKKPVEPIEPSVYANESEEDEGKSLFLILLIIIVLILMIFSMTCLIVFRKDDNISTSDKIEKSETKSSESHSSGPTGTSSKSRSVRKTAPKSESQKGTIILKTPSEMASDLQETNSTGSEPTEMTTPSARSTTGQEI